MKRWFRWPRSVYDLFALIYSLSCGIYWGIFTQSGYAVHIILALWFWALVCLELWFEKIRKQREDERK